MCFHVCYYNFFLILLQIQDLLSFFKFVIDQLISLKSSTTTIWFSDTIVKSILLAIRYLFLLPEMCSQLESADIALSIAIIPWIENHSNSNENIDYAEVPSLFPETKCESMKMISLHALANIFCPRAEFWKSSVFGGIINAINDPTQEKLVVEAIQALPVLLLDPYQQQIDVLQNLLRPTFESSSEAILTAISAVFCSVVCILSGNVAATIFAKHEGELFRTYVCLSCHKDFPRSPVSATNVLKSCKDVLNSCMTLLTCEVVAVRRNMAACLDSLVSHLPAMYNPEAVQTWMKYAEDEDHQVRIIFSEMVKFLIFSRDWIEGKGMESEQLQEEHIPLTQVDRVELSHSRPRLDCVLQLLYTGLLSRMSKKNTDSDVEGTLRATIVDIGCVPLDCVLRPVLKIVLVFLSHPEFNAPSIGHYYLQRIAKAHNTNVVNLYHRFQTTLCQVLVCGMGMNCHKPLWTKFMDNVIYGLGFESTTAWLRHSLKCILPSLVVYVVKFKHTTFLMKIIELLAYSPESVIKENFQFIYPFVFLNEPDHIVDECVGLMEEMSKTSAQQLILSSFKTIHNELLLHYHCKKERVEKGICQLIDVLEEKPKKHTKLQHPPKQADIAKHLEQRFLGVLVHFDMLLESSSTEESNKMNALQSLPHIIRLMGSKYITPVRLKVLSTLRTALRLTHCDFPNLSCGAWEAFIQSVDVRELGPLLGTVAASLLPLLDQFPDEVSSMLKCLVEKFEYELAEHIPDLFFLPDTPVLHDVYKVVQLHITKKRRMLNESQNLEDYLQQPLRFITHDNVDIRRHGLDYLLSLLKEKQAEFTKSLLQDGVVHDDVAKLLSLLIEGCRDTDVDIQRLCVENLGMIGALDPGHLPHKKPEIAVLQITSVDEDRFAVQALIALAKAYQAARNTRFLDSFAVAIQNLLKHYKISSQPSLNRKKLWDSFPLSVQQVMTPLENSSYFMTSMQSNIVWPHPMFGTRYALTLTNWAHTWACRIVTFIEDSHAKDMFTWCIPSLKRDINCVLFFLPFILLYAVMSGNVDQHRMMVEEMTFIIQQHSLREEEAGETTSASEKFQMHWDKAGHTPLVVDSDSATYVLCAKTVFSLLDFMEKWLGMAKKKMSNNTKSTSQVQNVQKFLSEFSKLDLAHGNYAVNEYARALMYLEDHLMEHKELLKDEEHLSFLERVFAQLNEPDGIKGVLAIQCSQPKLLEAVVFHEVAGQHQEALACFELLAKEHSNDDIAVRVQKGMIRCCLYLDQPYAALHIAEGALLKRPEYRSTFLEAQAECFWRVSNFENLEGVLKDPQLEGSNAWGVNIGKCLIDIRHRNQSSLREHLCSARSYLSKVLSTASLENGSYLQGYPHIIKLHMLQELEEASKVIDAITSPDMSEQSCRSVICNLIKVWEDRLALVQATSSVQESLLRLRRCLLQLTSSFVKEEHHILSNLMDHELGTSWLKSAEVARISGCYQQAYVYLLNAEKYKPKRHFIELAKLHWNKKEQDHALATLRRGLDQHFPNSKVFKTMALDDMVEDRKICAEAKLLVASYNDKNMNVDVDLNVSNYKDAVDVYQQWEKSHASLAQYYDRISLNDGAAINFDQCQTWAVAGYLKSLRFGCNLIYHSMSRLLTIWLDFGKSYQSLLMSSEPLPKKEMASKRDSLLRMNQQIEAYVDVLPAYMFMTGFSQLVSRMCHPMAEVNLVIKRIIVKLLISYPQQTMWMLVAMNRVSEKNFLLCTKCHFWLRVILNPGNLYFSLHMS
ncbi:hypothetical protein ONE63_000836 [Megalurothrips usitatus]|uniref:non-specific serine/threonine protein kinase n=1 Tax=Megalurothrips usitatus TaxID=439358 RepID=A0AAV7Y6R6_9NEOP|nr:hypothetical protein ONE63_000836 [Megalurothrips usitatus]